MRGFNGAGGGKVEAIVRRENVLWHSIGVIRLHQCVIEERLKCGVGKNWETVAIEFDQLVMSDNQISLCDSATC